MSKPDPKASRKLAAELLVAAPAADAFVRLIEGKQTLGDSVSLLRARSAWLHQFGELILRCGVPPAEKEQLDLPFAQEVSKLLAFYEQGLSPTSFMDGSTSTLTYLWLKSFVSLGQTGTSLRELESMFQRWTVLPAESSEEVDQAELILLAWLRRWGLDACELALWNHRHQSRPGSVTGQNNLRRSELRHKLIHRMHLPQRPPGIVLVGYREKASYKDIEEEAKSRLNEDQHLPVFLLQRPHRSSQDGGLRVADDTRVETLLQHLADKLRQDLRAQINSVSVLPVSVDLGNGSLQAKQPWVEIVPKDIDSFGLHGAAIWVRLDITRIAERSEVSYEVFGGVEPAGLTLEAFLRVVRVIKEQQDQELLKMLNNVDQVIGAALSDQAKLASRAALTGSLSDMGRTPV